MMLNFYWTFSFFDFKRCTKIFFIIYETSVFWINSLFNNKFCCNTFESQVIYLTEVHQLVQDVMKFRLCQLTIPFVDHSLWLGSPNPVYRQRWFGVGFRSIERLGKKVLWLLKVFNFDLGEDLLHPLRNRLN